MLPNGWKKSRFDGVADIANGQVDPKAEPYCGYLHIGPENVESGTGRIIAPELAKELGLISGKYEFDENTIVYSKIRPNLNKICVPNFKGICSADMYPIRPKNHISKEYLFYAMQNPGFVSEAIKCSMRTGLPKINRQDLNRIKLYYPTDKKEQFKVIEPIKKVDFLLSSLEKILIEKKSQKQALMQRLLTGKQRFGEFSEEVALSTLGTAIKEVTARNKGQKITRVLSVTNHSGFVLPEEHFSRQVASADLSNYKVVQKGQYAYNPSRINVGSLARLEQYEEGVLSPMYVVFKHDSKKLDSDYLFHWLNSGEARKRIAASTQGSVRDSVSFSTLASFKIRMPSIEEQQKIATVLNAADKEIELLAQKLEAYQEQKKGLMQQLLTGKKRVNITKEAA